MQASRADQLRGGQDRAPNPLRLLLSSPNALWPESSGGTRRTLGLARALATLGHQITLLGCGVVPPAGALGDSIRCLAFPDRGRFGHFWNSGFVECLDRQLEIGRDLVIAAFPYQALGLVKTCAKHQTPLIYDAHNLEAERFAGTGHRLIALLVSLAERHLVRHAQAVLAVSELDQQAFLARYRRRPTVLSNGVDCDEFTPGPADPSLLGELGLGGNRVALFFGSFDYRPNIEALNHLLSIQWPVEAPGQPATHLLVVGRQPPAHVHNRPGVVVTGEVGDVVPYLRLANLVLAPLSSGGGTRLKIIEALACAQQVLATPFGAAGLASEQVPGLHLSDLSAFSRRLQELLHTPLPPGCNDAGRHWALGKSWNKAVATIDWHGLCR